MTATIRGRNRLILACAGFAIVFVVAFGVRSSGQSPARLTAEDYSEILQMYSRYPLVLDSGDAEGYADLFTADGSFSSSTGGSWVGRARLVEFVKGRAATTVRHAPLPPVITPTAEGAKGVVMNMFIDVAKTPPVMTNVTQYTDTLVKTPQGWRFKTRVNGTAILAPK